MEQRVTMVTLGVADLDASWAFYTALGWSGQVVEETAFFQAGGIGVVLWDRSKLAEDAGLPAAERGGFPGIALAHNVGTRHEVDAIVEAALAAGATVTRAPRETFYGGWAGYFTDPDGHAWEIAHNPGMRLADDGTITIPDFGTDDADTTGIG